MIFLSIVDDYYLQGWLASAKQKNYWKQNAPDNFYEFYKYDYIMALFMHSFSWSFMIMIVPTIYTLTISTNINLAIVLIIVFFVFNLCLHIFTDNEKANKKSINLIGDQLCHLVQIIGTWFYFVIINI